MRRHFAILFCFFTLSASASEILFKYGIQMFQPKWTDVKMFALGYQDDLGKLFKYQAEVGLFADSRNNGTTRRSSAFATGSAGFEIEHSLLYLSAFWGIGFISSPDNFLSSVFEFNQDLSVGFRDARGFCIAVNYKHMSNAGLKLPNEGRDFLLIRLQMPVNF